MTVKSLIAELLHSQKDKYNEDWTCCFCKATAVGHIVPCVEPTMTVQIAILIETNGSIWLECATCDNRFHLGCSSELTSHITAWHFTECDECKWCVINDSHYQDVD